MHSIDDVFVLLFSRRIMKVDVNMLAWTLSQNCSFLTSVWTFFVLDLKKKNNWKYINCTVLAKLLHFQVPSTQIPDSKISHNSSACKLGRWWLPFRTGYFLSAESEKTKYWSSFRFEMTLYEKVHGGHIKTIQVVMLPLLEIILRIRHKDILDVGKALISPQNILNLHPFRR